MVINAYSDLVYTGKIAHPDLCLPSHTVHILNLVFIRLLDRVCHSVKCLLITKSVQ